MRASVSSLRSSNATRSQRSEITVTQDIALPSDYETGLEDFDPSQASLPRIQIVHADGVFKDSLTNEEFPVMVGVMLGLIKQRVMWEKDQQDDSKPQCKSNDGEFGYPNIQGPQHSLFPWHLSGITDPNALTRDEHGRPIIKCETCPFAQWRKNGAKNEPPPCSERYTIPIVFSTNPAGGPVDHAGIASFQRSGIAPLKAYISGFSRTKRPLFSSWVKVELKRASRGTVVYSVPVVQKLGPTNESDWEEYSREYRGVREMLRQAPRFDVPEPTPAPQSNAWAPQPIQVVTPTQPDPWPTSTPVVQAQTQPVWPAQQSAPSAPVVQAQVITPPVVQAPVVQAPVITQPVVVAPPPAPVAPPAPVVPPAPPASVVDAASSPVATAPVGAFAANDDDDLPF